MQGEQTFTSREQLARNTLQDGCFVLIRMPSTNQKLIRIGCNEKVSLGKFGTFQANNIMGHPFGLTYEIGKDGVLKQAVRSEAEDADEVQETDANNRTITDNNDHQQLSHNVIKAMAASGNLSGNEIINTLIENHATFEQKTEFSKAKYVKRKAQKFLKQFATCQPTSLVLCDYFFKKNSAKIRDIREDVLSLLLTAANVQAGSRILVADDTQGLVTSAIIERMGGYGEVVVLHETQTQNLDVLRYMNLPEHARRILHTVSYAQAFPLESESQWEAQADRQESRNMLTYRELRDKIQQGGFDGLVVASTLDALSVLNLLLPYIATSRPVVVYSTSGSIIQDVFYHMRTSCAYMLVDMLSTWYRTYQVLPQRTHPLMNMSGNGGFLVVGTKVDEGPIYPTTLTKEEIASTGRSNDSRRKIKKEEVIPLDNMNAVESKRVLDINEEEDDMHKSKKLKSNDLSLA